MSDSTKRDPTKPDRAVDLHILERFSRQERETRLKATMRIASQDFPLLPTLESDGLPSLPEEADDGLTPAQRLAVASLIRGENFAMAAKAAGVSRRTIYTWRNDPAFSQAVDNLSREALETTAIRVRNLMMRATRVLADAMVGGDSFNGAIRVANSSRLWTALNAGAAKLNEKAASAE